MTESRPADPNPTPAELGYRWPAEWEPHAATWLAWPHNRETWPGKFEPVPEQFAGFVRALAELEPVHVLAGPEPVRGEAESSVGRLAGVTLHDIPTNDAWARDYGPTFLVHPERGAAVVNWQYNAWGGKYPPYDLDNQVPQQIARALGLPVFDAPLVAEGGAIDGDGCGTVLTTASCLLNPNRNPGLTRPDVERLLMSFLAARRVLWLDQGEIAGDDTDGHIDQLARFVNPTTVVAALADDPDDENYEPLRRSVARLREMTDHRGRPLDVVLLPMPRPVEFAGQRLPASYANFLIANGGVLVPAFDDPADGRARAILAELFPERAVVSIPSRHLVLGLGSLHCLCQQQPAARAAHR